MTLTRRGTVAGVLGLGLVPHAARAVSPVSAAAVVEAAANAAAGQGFSGQVHLEIDGQAVLSRAWGRIGPGVAPGLTPRTRINIASISKSVTAVAVFKLADAGKLAVTDRLDRFLPSAPEDKAGITLAQLMDHGAGLPNSYVADGMAERDKAMVAILAEPLKFPPGTESLYSNLNYEVLAAVIEIASGEDYAAFVRRTVLAPAGMSDTRFWAEVDPRTDPDVARIAPANPDNAFDFSAIGRNWGYIGSGGIWSTAADVAAFVRAVTAGRLLKPASVAEMLAPRAGARGPSRLTFGWFVRGGEPALVWTRGNEDWGHNAVAYWWPGRRVLLTLTSNAGQHQGLAWSRWLGESLEAPILAALG